MKISFLQILREIDESEVEFKTFNYSFGHIGCMVINKGGVNVDVHSECVLSDNENGTFYLSRVESKQKGAGSILMKNVIDHVRNLGGKRIELHVKPTNENAIKLYKKFGFVLESGGTKFAESLFMTLNL